MKGFCCLSAVFFVLLTCGGGALGASEQAVGLRTANGLVPYAPPDTFLSGNFVADEIDPAYVFGKVADFMKSRSCPTSWFIEDGEKKRLDGSNKQAGPVEYTLYLEEDCPGRVVHYVFVDRSRADTAQWMAWRQQFHKNKTDPQYGAAKTGLDAATQSGFPVDGELRFMVVNGDLSTKKVEDVLMGELRFNPVYDIKQGKALSR